MRKLYLLPIFFCACQIGSIAQTTFTLPQRGKKCATYEVTEAKRRLNPNVESIEHFETWIRQKIQERMQSPFRLYATVTLPVVFHLIHDNQAVGTGANLNATSIQQQVMQLNKDFANLSYSPYGVSADMEIQFALAQTDPGGTTLAEPGIDRVNRVTEGFTAPPYTVGYGNPLDDYLSDNIKPATIWDPARYLNIWVLEMESGVLGIATFPSSSGLPGIPGGDNNSTAGVAIGPSAAGSVFAPNGGCAGSQYGKGRTLTHEMGHFLGLRHIWGDGTCATDFCGDTPTHEDANYGVPAHPKPNACGTTDEMFENYMDYCDDIVLNTFTADQKVRMLAVMTNSPRRNTLPTSTVGLVPVTGNRIAFYDCSGALTVSEAGTTGTYPRYRDISFGIQVENKATGTATITINPSGTAVNGFHYQVLTPSLAFATDDISKTVTVRLFDNAQVDGSRTLTLGYSITGTGVTAGSTAQTMTVTITDDDNVSFSETPVTLLTQDFSSSIAGWGFANPTTNHFVVSNAGDAGGMGNCAYISTTPGPTPVGAVNGYDNTIDGVSVLRSPLINATGYSDLQLNFKYKVWGEEDATDVYDFGMAMYATAAAPASFIQIPAPNSGPYANELAIETGTPAINLPNSIFSNASFHLAWYWENDNNLGNNPGLNIDDIVVTGSATRVETAVSNSYGFDVRSGSASNHFRSTNNRIIADVNNPNAAITGLTASVTQAGNGTAVLTTNTGVFQRSQKVVQFMPASPNTTATYQVTLYYTTAELAVWGGSVATLKILKVNDGVNLASVITGTNAKIANATVDDQRGTKGYAAFTATFTGGFSQFMLVSPTTTLPVDLLTFEARAVRKTIVLNWSTAQELSNKGFAIERSTNGTDFTMIGWVDGKINSSVRSDYTYTDRFVQPGVVYYYRLRQTDIDNHEELSLIRQARIEGSGVSITVTPNPATDQVTLFIAGAVAPANVTLVNTQGQQVRKWSAVNASAAPYKLNINGLSAGVYMLNIELPGEKLVEKVIIR